MRYLVTILALIALFIYLYKKAFEDFRSGYQDGLEIGNNLKTKNAPKRSAQTKDLL